jgi:hypothetical protein
MPSRLQILALAMLSCIADPLRANSSTPPITPEAAVESWCAAWSIENPAERMALIQRFWSADGVYSDPHAMTEPGAAALDEAIVKFQRDFPGVRFRCGAPQVHHAAMRHNWIAINADGSVKWSGTEFSELASDGRIRRVVSFFGDAPPVATGDTSGR